MNQKRKRKIGGTKRNVKSFPQNLLVPLELSFNLSQDKKKNPTLL